MIRTLQPAELSALCTPGSVLLVSQAYTARVLRVRLAADADPWANASLFSWAEWVGSLWSKLLENGVEDRILLNGLQEEYLWGRLIATQARHGETAAELRGLAALARTEFHTACAYRLQNRLRSEADTADARTFAVWVQEFWERCERERLLSAALLETELVKHLKADLWTAPSAVYLLGFPATTPAQTQLLQALRAAGTVVERVRLQYEQPGGGERLAYLTATEQDELQFTARRIAQRVQQQPPAERGALRFAVLTDNAEELRPELDRHFREILAPELQDVDADLSALPWQFSSPPPLANLPIVTDCLTLLRWMVEPLPLERLGQLLLSPFFSSDGLTAERRLRFEVRRLRQWALVRPSLDLSGFLRLLPTAGDVDAEKGFLAFRQLGRLMERADLQSGRRTHAEWADLIRRLLREAGWPGTRRLSHAEFEAVRAWEGLLDLLSTLQSFGERLSFASLLELLCSRAGEQASPTLNLTAPVQILTAEEASGLEFDHVFLLDASDVNLPVLPRLHPLLSQQLQRSSGLADVSAAVSRSRESLETLLAGCRSLTLLCPQESPSGEVSFSPLGQELGFRPTELSTEPVLEPMQGLEVTPEVSSMPELPSPRVQGGADLLRLQAACGFRAFATFRLLAKSPETQQLGFDARQTGRLLHSTLQHLWSQLRSQAALSALPPEARQAAIVEAIDLAFAKMHPIDADDGWVKTYLAVVRSSFGRLLGKWLDKELERAPFTVLSQESSQDLVLGPLLLSLRFDRVDEVEGGRVFIDYKTSSSLGSKNWLDTRPDQPQLPLYALSADPEQLKGIAFGRLRSGKDLGWVSLSSEARIFPAKGDNRQKDLLDLLETWRRELTSLAEAFAGGDTSVDPKVYPGTCEYCAHRALCRLDPATLLAAADQQPDAERHG